MKLEITSETIASAITIDWLGAHETETQDAWMSEWQATEYRLDGMQSLLIYASAVHSTVRKEAEPIMEDIKFLRRIAFNHWLKGNPNTEERK